MELIAETTKSKVFRIEDKVYKFRKHSKKKSFDNEMSIYNKINSLCLDNVIKFNNVDEDIMMIEMDYYPFNLESYFAGEYNVDTGYSCCGRKVRPLAYIPTYVILGAHEEHVREPRGCTPCDCGEDITKIHIQMT